MTDLVVDIATPLPHRISGRRPNQLFICGSCFHKSHRLRALEIEADGNGEAVTAHGMPRPELVAAAGARAYRSGFWGFVTLPAIEADRSVAIDLVATLDDATRMRVPLASVDLVAGRGDGDSTAVARTAICMATYEPPADLLERQIESIRRQTDEDWICLISDDNSSPQRLSGLESLIAGDPRFVLSRSDRRRGFFHNFERALEMVPASAEFVALADQDDYWYPEKLAVLLSNIGDAPLIYSDAQVVTGDGRVLSPTYWDRRRNNSSNFASLLLANTVSGAAALFRREVVDVGLPFPPAFGKLFHDHWLALVGATLGEIAFVDRPLYDYVQHERALLGHERAQAWADPGRGLGERLRDFRDRPQYFYEHWRTTYFQEYCRISLLARLLLARREQQLLPSRRRLLHRFVDMERSPGAIAWLAARQARALAGRDETLGAEGRLLRAFLWRRLLEAQSKRPSTVRARLPMGGDFPVDRVGPIAPAPLPSAPAVTTERSQ